MKYYILCGEVNLTDKISDFRLIAPSRVTRRYRCTDERNNIGIRINCDKSQVEKWGCDCYATSKEDTLIKNANPEVYTRLNGKWARNDELTKAYLAGTIKVSDIYDWLDKNNYTYANGDIGYTNKPFNYEEWRAGERVKARAYLDEHHPELTDFERTHASIFLSSRMMCVNDKGFEDVVVSDAINRAKESIEIMEEVLAEERNKKNSEVLK